jgi:hypothetical protein
MAKNKKLKLGWQKYEDLIEKQLSSPLIRLMTDTLSPHRHATTEESDEEDTESSEDDSEYTQPLILPFSNQFLEDVTMTANFECWIGHTNFDLTNKIKDMLDRTDGVEVLKVLSRYRFFIGIGKMFTFSEVRQNIEKILLKEHIDDKE